MAAARPANALAALPYKGVVVHPLVLLSVVDHYNRVAKDTKKRVVGILLGEVAQGKIDITNSYAVPFEEDPKDPTIWFLDHNFHESMYTMQLKINAREKIVGWYSTGPKIRPADIEIHERIRRYTPNPVFVIVDVNPKDDYEIPTEAYLSVDSEAESGPNKIRKTFVHLSSEIGASEPEEIGVEHLLRDIRDSSETTVADQVNAKLNSLKALRKRMDQLHLYLQNVVDGKMPVNNEIIYDIQNIFNLSPSLKVDELVKALAVNMNDNMLVLYLSSIIRSILVLHNLINNKITNEEAEKKELEQLVDGKESGSKDKAAANGIAANGATDSSADTKKDKA